MAVRLSCKGYRALSIRVHQVAKKFGTYPALHGVSIEARPGEFLALLGPSGSGKTTLLRIMAGLEFPDEGKVFFKGEDVTGVEVRDRRVGFVFQQYALFRHMTVLDNVAFGLKVKKWRERPSRRAIRTRAEELLDLVQLGGLEKRYPSQLSGGQRQRVALARALAVEPKLLLLDEPFGALDAQVRKELRTWLRRLHDEMHVTTVFVTHDQEEAMDVADRIVVMANAVIEQVGSPDELYEKPANDFVMSFLGPVTRLNGRLVRPHDIELLPAGTSGTTEAKVVRVVRLGFEVRVELEVDGDDVWVQVTRDTVDRLGLDAGSTVWLRASEHAIRPAVPSISTNLRQSTATTAGC